MLKISNLIFDFKIFDDLLFQGINSIKGEFSYISLIVPKSCLIYFSQRQSKTNELRSDVRNDNVYFDSANNVPYTMTIRRYSV